MHEQTRYHLKQFPLAWLLNDFFPKAYGSLEVIEPCQYEIPLERDDAKRPWWRTYRLRNADYERDFRSKVRAFNCLKVHAGLPLEDPDVKPLYFDVDLDEETYRDGLPCDCERSVCQECWFLVVLGIEVMRYVIVHVLGFEEERIKVLFSGRRGVHIWIMGITMNTLMRDLTLKRVRQLGKRGKHLHCRYTRYIHEELLLPAWRQHFRRPEVSEVPDRETLFKRLYPRLDQPVTKHPKHAIGCPLSTHKSTGNIIQPIPKGQERTFKPVHCTEVTPEMMEEWQRYLML